MLLGGARRALRRRTASGILVAPGRPWLHLRGHSGTTKRLPPALGFPVGNPEGLEEAFEDPQMNLKRMRWFLLEGAKWLRMHLRILRRTANEPQHQMHVNNQHFGAFEDAETRHY